MRVGSQLVEQEVIPGADGVTSGRPAVSTCGSSQFHRRGCITISDAGADGPGGLRSSSPHWPVSTRTLSRWRR